MKNLKLINCITLLSIIFFTNCSTDNVESVNQNFELSKNIILKSSTDYLSSTFLNIGVSSISVEKTKSSIYYKCSSFKSFLMNGKVINMDNYDLVFQDETFFLERNINYRITTKENIPYIISPNFNGSIKNMPEELFKNSDVNILILYLKEITMLNEEKESFNKLVNENNLSQSKSCSFWDTYYVYGLGGNKSVAQANLQSEIGDFTSDGTLGDNCSPIGGANTSCLWDQHACVSSQAFCCDNYSPA